MKYLFLILSLTFAQELKVEGNLNVTGSIQNDSLRQVIEQLEARISEIENSIIIFTGSVTDIDGNIYATVMLGGRLWTTENLRVTRFNNGDPINASHFRIDTENNEYFYSGLPISDEREICMSGWHVPTDAEFMELEIFLGMSAEAAQSNGFRGDVQGIGNRLKHEEMDGTNETGFSALGVGYYDPLSSGGLIAHGDQTYFWISETETCYRHLNINQSGICKNCWDVNNGASVRCIKD